MLLFYHCICHECVDYFLFVFSKCKYISLIPQIFISKMVQDTIYLIYLFMACESHKNKLNSVTVNELGLIGCKL